MSQAVEAGKEKPYQARIMEYELPLQLNFQRLSE
jgi:hypothetical protein